MRRAHGNGPVRDAVQPAACASPTRKSQRVNLTGLDHAKPDILIEGSCFNRLPAHRRVPPLPHTGAGSNQALHLQRNCRNYLRLVRHVIAHRMVRRAQRIIFSEGAEAALISVNFSGFRASPAIAGAHRRHRPAAIGRTAPRRSPRRFAKSASLAFSAASSRSTVKRVCSSRGVFRRLR